MKDNNIATLNVMTMHQEGKLDNNKQEATRLKVDVMGLAEVRFLDSGKVISDDYTQIILDTKKSTSIA